MEQVVGGGRTTAKPIEKGKGTNALSCSAIQRDSPVVDRHWNWAAKRPGSISRCSSVFVNLT